jgi:hypothetical protein
MTTNGLRVTSGGFFADWSNRVLCHLCTGKGLLEDANALGQAVETAFFKHVFTRYYQQSIAFSYWRGGKKDQEVDIIADVGGRLVPFEVKYRGDNVGSGDLKGLIEFCKERKVKRAYVITKDAADFGVLPLAGGEVEALKIPAPLACYWLGRSELEATDLQDIDA